MCKVVAEGMKEEGPMDDGYPPVEPADLLKQQDDVQSQSMQKTTNHEDNKENEIVCKDCGKVYATVVKLKKHVYDMHKKLFLCTEPGCEKTFRKKITLQRHKMTHTGEKPFLCTEPGCEKTFRHKLSLQRHKMTHTGEKPFLCTEHGCEKAFRQKRSLEAHKLTHTGEKAFLCTEHSCEKAFRQKQTLEQHKVTHIGEKPYRCSAANCGKAYADSSGLWRHKQTQHKGMLQDEVEVEQQVPAHEVIAGGGLLLGEEVLVKGEGVVKEEVVEEVLVKGEVVKEEVVEEKDGAECGAMEEDPLRILPEGEGLVKEEVIYMEDRV